MSQHIRFASLWGGVCFSLLSLVGGGAFALSLEEMMQNTVRAAKESVVTPNPPAAKQPRIVAPSAPASPVAPASPAASAAIPTSPAIATSSPAAQEILVKGNCGLAGHVIGCPVGGITVPADVPEMRKMVGSLTRLMAAKATNPSEKIALIHLAQDVSKIDATALAAQVKSLAAAPIGQQIGALRYVRYPTEGSLVNKTDGPVEMIKMLIEDAADNGKKLEQGMRNAQAMLRAFDTPKNAAMHEDLTQKIASIEKLIQSKAASSAAKQLIAPFYDSYGMPRKNGKTGQPLKTEELAKAFSYINADRTLKDPLQASDTPPKPLPAMRTSDRAKKLEYYY
jgi:hypothetical protein